jgi:hypothetical protein
LAVKEEFVLDLDFRCRIAINLADSRTAGTAEFEMQPRRGEAPTKIGEEKLLNLAPLSHGAKSEKQVLDYFGSIGIERTEEMRKVDFDNAMKWALSSEALQ